MHLPKFLVQSMNTLLSNQEIILKILKKVEKELVELKSVMHASKRIKLTAQRSSRTIMDEEDEERTKEKQRTEREEEGTKGQEEQVEKEQRTEK